MTFLIKIAAITPLFPLAAAAEPLVAVRVYTRPPGVFFNVDGLAYSGPATFMWPAGSRHTLSTTGQSVTASDGIRYAPHGWFANDTAVQPATASVVVTADPKINSFRAELDVEYALMLRFNPCSAPPCDFSPGTVFVEQTPYTHDADLWARAGTLVHLQATPAPGYVFVGWIGPSGAESLGFFNTIRMDGPKGAHPRFEVARRVTLLTSPPGLRLLADRSSTVTPATMDWGWNTSHTLSPISPQADNTGKVWIFSSWNDGAEAMRAYKVQPLMSEDVLTATFVPAARLSFLTSPPGLKLRVDGRDNWTGVYNFSWAVGETHRVEAPAEQIGADGRKYVFRGWSNGGQAAQDVTVTEAHLESGMRLTAKFEMLGRVTIQSTLASLLARVEGQDCAVPCSLDRPVGTRLQIAVPAWQAAGDESRYMFQGWGDEAAPERSVTLGADVVALQASYALMNRLVTASDPPGGAKWRVDPPSSDGFYDPQTAVAVAVDPVPGFRFRRFEGDLNGLQAAGTVRMSAPRMVRAVLERVPYLPSAAVRSAAGEIPAEGVAPGSVIAISGLNLADQEETGPQSPLAQTLGGITVRLEDRLLALYSVSPEQIRAHLPYDLEPGAYNLAVRRDRQPEVKTTITVLRNAPGLFAAAVHEDGSPVSEDNPVRAGELITLYGTGLGPYRLQPLEGFPIPDAPSFDLLDTVEVLFGVDVVAQPVSAAALAGAIGIDAVRLRLPEALTGTAIPVTVRSNGVLSNTVALPAAQQ